MKTFHETSDRFWVPTGLNGRRGVPPLPLAAVVPFLLIAATANAHAPMFDRSSGSINTAFWAASGLPVVFEVEASAPAVEAPTAAAPVDQLQDLEVQVAADAIKGLLAAGKAGKWLLAVMFALKLIIWLLRLLAKKLPPSAFTRFFLSRWGGWILNFAGSQVGAFATAAATGVLTLDIALGLVIAGVTTSLAAAGTRELVNDVKPAQAAGLAAAANPGPTLGA